MLPLSALPKHKVQLNQPNYSLKGVPVIQSNFSFKPRGQLQSLKKITNLGQFKINVVAQASSVETLEKSLTIPEVDQQDGIIKNYFNTILDNSGNQQSEKQARRQSRKKELGAKQSKISVKSTQERKQKTRRTKQVQTSATKESDVLVSSTQNVRKRQDSKIQNNKQKQSQENRNTLNGTYSSLRQQERPSNNIQEEKKIEKIAADGLLNGEQEIYFTKQYQQMNQITGFKSQYVKKHRVEPSQMEIARIFKIPYEDIDKRIKQGMRARQVIEQANQGLIYSVCKHYQNKGIQFQELKSEATMGLYKGMEKFDTTKGFRFSTYVVHWIRQYITKAIATHTRPVRLPGHYYEEMKKVQRARAELLKKFEVEPDEVSIAEQLKWPLAKLQRVRRYCSRTLNMDDKIGSESSDTFGDFMEDTSTKDTIDEIHKFSELHQIEDLLDCLNPRERSIIRYRYGVVDGQQWTLHDISNQFNLTRERVRQIQNTAIEKLNAQLQSKEQRQNYLQIGQDE